MRFLSILAMAILVSSGASAATSKTYWNRAAGPNNPGWTLTADGNCYVYGNPASDCNDPVIAAQYGVCVRDDLDLSGACHNEHEGRNRIKANSTGPATLPF